MTKAELFEIVTKMIAETHSQITEHDKRRAVQVFLAFDEYMVDVDVAAGRCDRVSNNWFCCLLHIFWFYFSFLFWFLFWLYLLLFWWNLFLWW